MQLIHIVLAEMANFLRELRAKYNKLLRYYFFGYARIRFSSYFGFKAQCLPFVPRQVIVVYSYEKRARIIEINNWAGKFNLLC